MKALDAKARAAGVACVNEVGLDPGIDHLMAMHWSQITAPQTLMMRKYPLLYLLLWWHPERGKPFRYKFSWSPLGVLKALRSPSRSIRDFAPLDVARPWDAISSYEAPLPTPESFEVYPNRDSIPFMEDYKFDPDWSVKEFVRGTLRLNGWTEAWSDVFREIETLSGPKATRASRKCRINSGTKTPMTRAKRIASCSVSASRLKRTAKRSGTKPMSWMLGATNAAQPCPALFRSRFRLPSRRC